MRYLLDLAAYEELHIGGKSFLLVHGGLGRFSADKPLSAYDLNELVWTRPDCSVPWTDDPDRCMVSRPYADPAHQRRQQSTLFGKTSRSSSTAELVWKAVFWSCLCLDTMKAFYV